jgi:calcineurin-like phosphoesterase family protein
MATLRLDLAPAPESIKVGVKHPDLRLNRDTWIISDTHFGHANIIKYCGRPWTHNTIMLKSWRKLIAPQDYVLHLGDVTIWHTKHVHWAQTVSTLPGKKFLILGNHDEQWTAQQWRTIAGFTVTDPFIDDRIIYSHVPATPSPSWDANVHGHSHNHTPFRRYNKLQTTYYNVSVEATNYKPIRLGEILDELAS